ncbi:hypothetical protein Trydic_g12145 [Trypoxylus dichotomus]
MELTRQKKGKTPIHTHERLENVYGDVTADDSCNEVEEQTPLAAEKRIGKPLIANRNHRQYNWLKRDGIIHRLCNCLINLEKLQTVSGDEADYKEREKDDKENVNKDRGHKEEENDAKSKEDRKFLTKKQEITYDTGFMSSQLINFRNVEDAVRKYDGIDDYPVRKWVEDVEDIGERGLNNWKDLKTALLEEFGKRITSAQLLAERKMHKNENLLEYFLHMKELTNRGSIEEAAIIQYSDEKPYVFHVKEINPKRVTVWCGFWAGALSEQSSSKTLLKMHKRLMANGIGT